METVVTERPNGTRRVQHMLSSQSKVEQSHKKRVNINTIMAKARKGLQVPLASGSPLYGDFTDVCDFHTAKNKILQAQDDFMSLPSHIRAKFLNDPGLLVTWLQDPENLQEAVELGLIPREALEPVEPPKPPVEPETPPEGA